MRKPAFLLLLALTVSMTSCESFRKKKNVEIKVKASLIHPFYFQDDIGQTLNFPFWFNDSIIRSRKIETITHITYGSALDTDEENDLVERLPKKSIIYKFNELGELIQVTQTSFSEGIIIANHNFYIRKSKWPLYHYVIADEEHLGLESANHIFTPKAKKKNVTQYDDEYYEERLHYISNEKYFGALSVDSIAHPSAKDWVILGTPDRPTKKYKVKNKVKEKQVTTYEYWNDNYPKVIVNPEFPFTNRRYFSYQNGLLSGYTDSVFIDKDLVTVITTKMKYKNGLPVNVEHIKNHEGTEQPFKKIEEFKYSYFRTNQ